MDATLRSYQRLAWCYDELAAVYSFGLIPAARRAQLRWLRPGERVLYAGVGRGSDAAAAAALGATVTGVDLSHGMLRRARQLLEREKLEGELLCESLFEHTARRPYDAVVANYVLDCFDPLTLGGALDHLIGLVRPGGVLLIADFAPASGTVTERGCRHLHYGAVALAAAALGLGSLHRCYDYGPLLLERGLCDLEALELRWRGRGPALHTVWAARTHV